jgi:hypothetical protein
MNEVNPVHFWIAVVVYFLTNLCWGGFVKKDWNRGFWVGTIATACLLGLAYEWGYWKI